MKITSISLLCHDSSLCTIKDGTISSYQMEERFSRIKHDARIEKILQNISNLSLQKIYLNSVINYVVDFNFKLDIKKNYNTLI